MKTAKLIIHDEMIKGEEISVFADPLHDVIIVNVLPKISFWDRFNSEIRKYERVTVSNALWLKIVNGEARLNMPANCY